MKFKHNILKKINYSYLTGVLLGLNAVENTYVLFDSPNCVNLIAENIFLNHDSFSTLLTPWGPNRVINTTPSNINQFHKDRTEIILHKINDMNLLGEDNLLFFCSMPVTNLTGVDYESMISNFNKQNSLDMMYLPQKSLTHDWVDGYNEVIMAIAKHMTFDKKKKAEKSIGIVGYLWDRNEGDHKGNIIELKRILKKANIDIISVWLEGKNSADLKSIEKASLIVCFPPFEDVAKVISKKTGAQVLVMDLPFGIDKTKEFVEKISNHFGLDCKNILKEELEQIIPLCSKFIDFIITDNSFSFYGEPYFAVAFHKTITALGGKLDNLVLFSKERRDIKKYFDSFAKNTSVQFQPSSSEVKITDSDIHVGNSTFADSIEDKSFVLIGYPSLGEHYFASHPFLGFKGFVLFLNKIYNSIRNIKLKLNDRTHGKEIK